MATYKTVYTSFWTDSKVADDFTIEERYMYLYLFTNPHTSLSGCYEISLKQHIAVETGYTADKIVKLIDRLANVHKVIKYCKETREILIVNWYRYNWTTSPKFTSALKKEIEKVKCPEFKAYLTALANGEDAVLGKNAIQEYGINSTVIDTVNDSDNDSDTSKPDPLIVKRFEQFWEIYPKKSGKGAARKSWEKIKPNAELFDKIMAAVRANIDHNKQWQRDNGQYIPNPSTWLNQERWDDDISSMSQDDYFTRELKKMGGIGFE